MRQRNGTLGLTVGEEPEGLVPLRDVRRVLRIVVVICPRVELEGCDCEEGLIGREALRVRVEDGDKFAELIRGGWGNVKGTRGKRE